MKAKNIILTIALVLVWSGTGLAADADSSDERPYIGVMLDDRYGFSNVGKKDNEDAE